MRYFNGKAEVTLLTSNVEGRYMYRPLTISAKKTYTASSYWELIPQTKALNENRYVYVIKGAAISKVIVNKSYFVVL